MRVKQFVHYGQECYSIHFSDVSQEVEAMKLDRKVTEQEILNLQLVNYQITIAHEYRTPLQNSLMMLDSTIASLFSDLSDGQRGQANRMNNEGNTAQPVTT